MPTTFQRLRVPAVLVGTAAALALSTTLSPAHAATPVIPSPPIGVTTTQVTGFAGIEERTGGQEWTRSVTVTPAEGRTVLLQQETEGGWETRETYQLDAGAVDTFEVALPAEWQHRAVTRWRLLVPATTTASPASSGILHVWMQWTAGERPSDVQVLVNKQHPLDPIDWEPSRLIRPDVAAYGDARLRPVAARALERLAADAEAATGRSIVLVSAYRSHDRQVVLHRRYTAQFGARATDRFSARAGHSEHQTGLAADITEAGTDYTRFGATESSDWVDENAWRYGYVVRYTDDTEPITGYKGEPWHLRYVGPDLAAYLHHSGVPLETAVGAGPAPDYP